KMPGVLFVGIAGRQVHPAAEPGRIALFEIAEIRMDRGDHGITGVKHKRDAGREELGAGSQRNFCCEFFRKTAVNLRKVDAGLFKDGTVLENARAAPATAFE